MLDKMYAVWDGVAYELESVILIFNRSVDKGGR